MKITMMGWSLGRTCVWKPSEPVTDDNREAEPPHSDDRLEDSDDRELVDVRDVADSLRRVSFDNVESRCTVKSSSKPTQFGY